MTDSPRPLIPPFFSGLVTGMCIVGLAWIIVAGVLLLRDMKTEGMFDPATVDSTMADIAKKQESGQMFADFKTLEAQVEELELNKKQLETELEECKQRLVDPEF